MISHARLTATSVCILCLVAGCAGIHSGVAANEKSNGIRYYRPATYYLVKPDYEHGGASVTTWTGPDTKTLFTIEPYAFMATNNAELEFDHGILSKFSDDTDTTKFATESIAAFAEVAKAAMDAAAAAAKGAAIATTDPNKTPPIFLFKSTSDGIKRLFPKP